MFPQACAVSTPPSPPLIAPPSIDANAFLEAKLFEAVRQNRLDEVKALLKSGDLKNVRDVKRNPPLHIAAEEQLTAMMGLLLAHGFALEATNCDGMTPLHKALKSEEAALFLLKKGANPNAIDDEGYTPVDYAWGLNNRTLFDAFLNQGGRLRTLYNSAYNSLLFETYQKNHPKAYNHLLALGVPIDWQNEEGGTVLLVASSKGDLETVRELLSKGANPDIKNKMGNTALHLALDKQHPKIAELLILAGADVDTVCENHQTPLHMAAINGYFPLVQLLLAKGANIHRRSVWGTDALYIATERKHYAIAEFLVDKGADPRKIDETQSNTADLIFNGPCHDAPQSLKNKINHFLKDKGNLSNALFLLISQFKTLHTSSPGERDWLNFKGISPFAWSVFKEEYGSMRFLAEQGSDINIQLDEELQTPLMLAQRTGNVQLIRMLLDLGAKPDLQDENGNTALMRALKNGQIAIAELLMERGADINLANHENDTPLITAAVKGNEQIIASLLKKGAQIDHYNMYHNTALGVALINEHSLAAELLIDAGAEVNLPQGAHGASPLFLACASNLSKIALKLLKKGACVNARNNSGVTPLFRAVSSGVDCVQMLLEAGASTGIQEYYGHTPLTTGQAHDPPKGISHLAQKLYNEPLFAELEPFPFSRRLIAYLCLQKDKTHLKEQIERAKTLCTHLAALKEPDKLCEEFFFHMAYINPSLVHHPLYLQWLIEAFKSVNNEDGLHCLVTTASFSDNPETFLATFKQILTVHTKTEAHPTEESLLKYHAIYRTRDSVGIAYALLSKGAPCLSLALTVLTKVGARRAKDQTKILEKIYFGHPALRVQVLEAMWATKPDPHHIKGKQRVIETFMDPQTTDQDKCRLLEIMNHYFYSSEDGEVLDRIAELSRQTESPELRRACALAMIHMGGNRIRALEIIQSSDWDIFSQEPYCPDDDEHFYYHKWYTIPPYHLHRERMVEVVYEKMAQSRGPDFRSEAEAIYERFALQPELYPSIHAFQKRLLNIPESARFVKPLLIYPEDTFVFRGLTEKGVGRDTMLHDIATTGVSPADLSLMKTIHTSHWARLAQFFFTHKLKYISKGFWSANATLIGITSAYINRENLKGRVRFEKEGGALTLALYDKVPLGAIQKMWVLQKELAPVTQQHIEKKTRMIDGRWDGLKLSLVNRQTYHGSIAYDQTYHQYSFDIEKNQIASNRRLIRESVIHFIMREMVKAPHSEIHVIPPPISCNLDKMSFKDFTAYLEERVFSEYAKPFPPVFKNGFRQEPNLMEYAKPYADLIPRWVHGKSHASRTVINACAMMEVMKRYLQRQVDNPHTILLGAAMHDIIRPGDGADPEKKGDIESGKSLQAELMAQGVPFLLAKRLGELNAAKCKRDTFQQQVVDGADCAEILRLRRFAKGFTTYSSSQNNTFKLSEWPLYAELCRRGKEYEAFANNLLKELHLFARFTEQPSIKLPLELESKNICIDHLLYLKNLHDEFALFPILTELLKTQIAECPPSTDLSPKLLELGSRLQEQREDPDFQFEW